MQIYGAGQWLEEKHGVKSRGDWRKLHGKKDVLVVDYVDTTVPVVARMAAKRRAGYRTLGYVIE